MKIREKLIKILGKISKEIFRKQNDCDVQNIKRKRQTDGGGEKKRKQRDR